MTQLSTLPNPFVGLRPYLSDDSLFYFGRNEQTKTLLRLLHQHRFVAVVGSSGAGKSSLIRAGLVPQLEAGFLVQERDQWLVATAKPGDAPLQNLVNSLLSLLDTEQASLSQHSEQLTSEIEEHGTQALLDVLKPQLANSDCNLFILVDQFEELFRFGLEKGQTTKRQQAEQYVALLLSLSRHELPIYVCLTMRSDFLGDCDAFYGLPEAINKSQFLVPRLTRGQRQEVITNPVNLADAKIAPRLVDKLLNENIDTRDDLPILQHVLMRTWDVWQESGGNGALDIEHYEKAHTIHQALDRHADEALEELNDEQKHIAKVLFQALTTVDAGNRRIRRPAHLNEVSAIANASPDAVMKVIDCFCEQNRSFLVLSSPNTEDNPLIDISHESLIRQWNTLGTWAEEENASVKTLLRLCETSELHEKGKASLYSGNELLEARKWYGKFPNKQSLIAWMKQYTKKYNKALAFLEKSSRKTEVDNKKRQKELERRVALLSNSSIAVRRKQTLITLAIMLLALSLLFSGFIYLYDRNTKQDLTRKYEAAASDLMMSAPIFSDDEIYFDFDSEQLTSVLKDYEFSRGFDDDGTENEFFAYFENLESNEIYWISKFPYASESDYMSFSFQEAGIQFNFDNKSNDSPLNLFEVKIMGEKLEYFVYSRTVSADDDLVRVVIAESSAKYRNNWSSINITVVLLFIITLVMILISHLISARLVRSPMNELEREIKSIIVQSNTPP